MFWPQASDYREAVQNLALSFRDQELSAGQAASNALGLPTIWTGNFASVFHVQGTTPQQNWALKCFTKDKPGLQERYRQIHAHLEQQRQRLPFMVGFSYLPEEVLVCGKRYPLLKMDWVEGLRLDEFLADLLTKADWKSRLRRLCEMWLRLAQMLRDAEVAHGDLQHGNVLLVPVAGKEETFNLRLIDYDGMCVPALRDQPPGEVGHAAYQHPERLARATHGLDIDRFSHLVIYTTLRCLIAGGRELWERHYDGDRLLLGPQDLAAPEQSAIFRELWQLEEPAIPNLVGHLALAAKGPLEETPLLSQLVLDSKVVALNEAQRGLAARWLSPTTMVRPGLPAAGELTRRLTKPRSQADSVAMSEAVREPEFEGGRLDTSRAKSAHLAPDVMVISAAEQVLRAIEVYQDLLGPRQSVVQCSPYSRVVAGLLAMFFGVFGIHNFYLGRNGTAVCQLVLSLVGGVVTCGLASIVVYIWAFIEAILIFAGVITDGFGRPLRA